MNENKFRSVLISDFNIDILSGYLNNDESLPVVETTVATFGQVIPLLMQENLEYWNDDFDFTLIWTRPEGVINSFNDLLANKNPSIKDILNEVDQFAVLLSNISQRISTIFVPTWTVPSYIRGLGMLDMKKDIGIANTLMQMNIRLAEKLDHCSNVYLLDIQKWINNAGKYAFNPRLWYRGKVAFGNDVYKETVRDIKSALNGIHGHSKKLVILDLDNTLWGGVVGDLGWENIVLGGHDPIGEAFIDFQTALKSLANRGILLGIVSKNEESTALEAINNHPEMVLKSKDFAGWKINWQDKAQNIVDLVSDLNLGLQSAVFIDDNPLEQARVREAFPEVLVPEWPDDSMLYIRALNGLRCFDTPSISKEDIERTKMYANEQQRNILRRNLGSLDDWLMGLDIKIQAEELIEVNLQRTIQLLNKTNQMNLTTRRMTEKELVDWVGDKNHMLWTFRVSDKFGDSGLTGIISLEVLNNNCRIVDFILSCRVIGRKVEETMLYTAIQYAKSLGLSHINAEYIPSQKNKPCLEFWQRSGFHSDKDGHSFIWDLQKEYDLPHQIKVIQIQN